MRSSPVTRTATALFVALLLVGALVVLAAGLGVEYLGPIIVLDSSLVCVYMLSAPSERPHQD